jgi:hypothetical protein
MKSSPHKELLSTKVENWLLGKDDKTISGAQVAFGDRVVPVLIVMLMALPSLPIPTGGISHVMEVIAAILALQMLLGVDRLLIPKSWQNRRLPEAIEKSGFGLLVKQLKRIESKSRMRGTWLVDFPAAKRLTAICALIGIAAAFFAPPFSGLDTFPAFGVVMLMLGYILRDGIFWLLGATIALLGIVLELTVGAALLSAVKSYYKGHKKETIIIGLILVLVIVIYTRIKHKK